VGDRVEPVRQICRCGHDIDTHHERQANCLGIGCKCPFYRDPEKPDGLPRKKPHHAEWCRCYGCVHGVPWEGT
jgi:hypothetical protein